MTGHERLKLDVLHQPGGDQFAARQSLAVDAVDQTCLDCHLHRIGVRMLKRHHQDEGASARDAGPLFANNQHVHSGVETPYVKRLANAAAKLALAGFTLHASGDGGFTVGRWNYSRQLTDLAAVEQFLSKVSP